MSDASHGDGKKRPRRGLHSRKRLTDAELKRAFVKSAESFTPSEDESNRICEMIRAVTAVAGMEQAEEVREIEELDRLVGLPKDGEKRSFVDMEDSRIKPHGIERDK